MPFKKSEVKIFFIFLPREWIDSVEKYSKYVINWYKNVQILLLTFLYACSIYYLTKYTIYFKISKIINFILEFKEIQGVSLFRIIFNQIAFSEKKKKKRIA